MTPFQLPPLVVDYNQLWLAADVLGKEDPKAWAWRAAAQLLARPQFTELRTPERKNRLAAIMEQAAALARKRQVANMGFFLVPSPKGLRRVRRGRHHVDVVHEPAGGRPVGPRTRPARRRYLAADLTLGG
jgi:hypothetical protein